MLAPGSGSGTGHYELRTTVCFAARVYVLPSLAEYRPSVDVLGDPAHRIHAELEFKPGTTTVSTSVDGVLDRRQGGCQYFAHVMPSCQRYITLAWGTDVADVVLLRGVILGGGSPQGVDVSVSVMPQG